MIKKEYEIVVIGGGLAGICAAISAARLGAKVALVQDRPVLGGNSSSEIRVAMDGAAAFNPWARETGIIEELILEDRVCNHNPTGEGLTNSLWDLVLYERVKKEANIELFLNTSARKSIIDGRRIKGVLCSQLGTEEEFVVKGDFFVDATGDGSIAASAGAEFRMGREGKDEFNESLAPEKGDAGTMGSSLHFRAKDVGHPVPFTPPSWAIKYSKCTDLRRRDGGLEWKAEAGYWWIEIGTPFNIISDNEKIKDELLKHLLGIWDHIKNHEVHRVKNLNSALDWIGVVPGKRESRRIVGEYILKEDDIKNNIFFPDAVAFGGWYIDLHTVGGLLAKGKEAEETIGKEGENRKRLVLPYCIPLRCLYSKDIKNLMLAGRDISVTHVALGTTRIMTTCAVIGQAVGAAAYFCKRDRVLPAQIHPEHIKELQQQLLKDDCFIPGIKNDDSKDLAKGAKVSSSSPSPLIFPEKGKESYPLDVPRGQIFPVSSERIEEVSLLIESRLTEEVELKLGLRQANNVWDLKAEEDLSTVSARVPPQKVSWVKFRLNQRVEAQKFYWIYLEPKNGIFWRYGDGRPVGTAPLENKGGIWYWMGWWQGSPMFYSAAFIMKLNPPSFPYQPENIISGVSRPYNWTNLWISHPEESFPQYVELSLGKIKTFNTIYLTFDTNLNRSYYGMSPFFRAPECVKDYKIYAHTSKGWREILDVRDNFQRHRIHKIKPVKASKLKIEILNSNGIKTANIYEVRVYNES